ETPLTAAAQNGHTDIVRLLIAYGTNVNGRGSRNSAALDIRIDNKANLATKRFGLKLFLKNGSICLESQTCGCPELLLLSATGSS
ncbi:hypothetical protein AWC38_SpisGene25696, partial [Stylophora pistillata]